MIRPANIRDVSRIAELGEQFFREAGWADIAEWDNASIIETLTNMVGCDAGIVLVLEIDGEVLGMAGGLIYPMYFNRNHITGQEIFWWVAPEHRGKHGSRLLDALESEAKQRGAQSFTMIALDKVNPELVGRAYERRGYRATERSYMRKL